MKTLKLLNYHIQEITNIEHLSVRTRNVCINSSMNNLYKILIYYLNNGNFLKIKNCGEKTDKELTKLCEEYIKKFNVTLDDLMEDEEDIIFEKFKFYSYEKFNVLSEEIEIYRAQFLNKKLKFFKFVSLTIKKILNKREFFAFERNFGYLIGEKKMTLQSIGNNFKITRERIRQISQYIPSKIENIFNVFFNDIYFINNYFHYDLNIHKDYIIIDSTTAETINKDEHLNYTPKFYALIFSALYHDNYRVFQENKKKYNNYFLINKELTDRFDFGAYYNDVYTRFNKRIEKTYIFNFDEYLKKFLNTDDTEILERIRPVSKDIIYRELNIEVDANNNIIFNRNTMIRLPEYIVEILNDYGHPMPLKDIAEELRKRTIKSPQNIESLRSSILSIDEISAIGKTSTYSLKKWKDVKTGTIKSLVIEYLNKYDKPVNISEIIKYINKYRKTKEKNVLSNLKLDNTNTFLFYKKGYVGLKSKKYKVKDLIINGKRLKSL